VKNNENSPSIVYDFNSNNIVAYTVNKGFIEFVFNQNSKNVNEKLPFDYKITKETFSLPTIIAQNYLKDALTDDVINSNAYFDIIQHDEIAEIINVFNINPHVMGYYADKSSGVVFIGEDVSLSISSKGEVEYYVSDADAVKITISELINSPRNTFSTGEVLTALTSFLDKFSEFFFNGSNELILKDMSYSKETALFTFEFSHYFDKAEVGIP
jgi:hypothetical protein